MEPGSRVVVAGPGSDRRARELRDAGCEVVLLETDEPLVVVAVCLQEDADALAWGRAERPPGLPEGVELLPPASG